MSINNVVYDKMYGMIILPRTYEVHVGRPCAACLYITL